LIQRAAKIAGWGLLGLIVLAALLYGAYRIATSITRYEIDRSVEIRAPESDKSAAEHYAFGFQPDLTYTETRTQCAERFDTKRAMFGDLHIHTAISADAFPDGTRTYPEDVYRFAQGEQISLPTPDGQEPLYTQLARPLDFASVTDHSETFGEGYICRNPGEFPGYDSEACQTFRAGGEEGVREFMGQNGRPRPERDPSVCGADGSDCEEADRRVWQRMIAAAEEADDKSEACQFTAFVGYEYTRAPNAQHMHRNTIFRNANVPERAASFFSHNNTWDLLSSFEQDCRLGLPGCDVLSIPHNSNISGGNAFNPYEVDGFSQSSQRAYWELRSTYDRLMEIMQHKGSSECVNGATDVLGDVDELCEVEAIRQFGQTEQAADLFGYAPKLYTSQSPECSAEHVDGKDNLHRGFCLSSRDFARGALLYGIDIEERFGVNPFSFGFIGSSDTHLSLAGATNEPGWPGHIAYEVPLEGRLSGNIGLGRFNRIVSNPGGLAGVYAVERSRDAIFQSMKRREAFATSGTRIEPRFFAGRFAENICQSDNWLNEAYASGTPMGSQLGAQSEPFQLLVQARRDPMSNPLERLQLIKGWIDAEGNKHAELIRLSESEGADQLCAVYTDPDYDPSLPTYYYMRAVETATARWSSAQCASLPASNRPAACENDQPELIYEMAWASPIWFSPNAATPLATITAPGGAMHDAEY